MEHHEKAGCLFPKIGMRNVKTALAAALCALVYYFLDRNPTFACIGAIFGMGSSFMQSRLHGGNRFFGTMVGGFIGMGLFAIYMELFPDGSNAWVLIPLTFVGVIILILLCQHIWVGGVQPGGVVLCILAVVPLMLGVGLASSDVAALLVRVAPADVYAAAAVDALLLLVACGVGVLVWSGTYTGAMDQLLEEGDYTRKKKARSGVMSTVSLIYWLSVTAIFLFYTFGPRGNGQPQYSWFIWAVGGVLYAAVMGIVSLVLYHKDKM